MPEPQQSFFGFVVGILQSIQQGITGTTHAAREAAKEATAAKEAAQRQGRGGDGGGGRSPFDVLSGRVPGDRNAQSITKMLRDGIFGKGGQPPPVPPSAPPAQPANPAGDQSTYDFADATYDLAPEPEQEQQPQGRPSWRQRIRGMGRNVRSIGRHMRSMAAKKGYDPEAGVPPLPKPLDMPAGEGAVGAATEAAGAAAGAEGTAGAAGAATAGLASLATVATSAVSIFAAFTGACVVGAKKTLEAAQALGRFSPAIARVNALMAKQEIRLDIQQAKATGETTAKLGQAYMEFRQELAPLKAIWTNLSNKVMQFGTNLATGAAGIANWLAEANGIKRLSDWLNDSKGAKEKKLPFVDYWHNVKVRRYHAAGQMGRWGQAHRDIGPDHDAAVARRQLDREAEELKRRHEEGLKQHLAPVQRKAEEQIFQKKMAENRRRRQEATERGMSPAKRMHLDKLAQLELRKKSRKEQERQAIRDKARGGVKIAAIVLPDLADEKNQHPKCQLPEHVKMAIRGMA